MNIPHLPLLAALLMSAMPSLSAWAQASAPAPTASAPSAPPATTPAKGPRLLSPAERRDNADAASPDLRPERPVVPQISIPFGKSPPPLPASASAPRAARKAPTGGVADAAARCDAQPSDEERAACRKRNARISAPN
jgi:hypothetical protein